MKRSIFLSIMFLLVYITGLSQITETVRDSINDLLVGQWYWVGTSGGLGGSGYGGPIENGYTVRINFEKMNEEDSLRFTTYKDDHMVKTGKIGLIKYPLEVNTWRMGNILPVEQSLPGFPDEKHSVIEFKFVNNSILFLNRTWTDSFEYLYSHNPCKDCFTRKLVNPHRMWIVTTEVFDGNHFLPIQSHYWMFGGTSTIDGHVYGQLYSSDKSNSSDMRFNSYWREDELGKVFIRYSGQNEKLMYDFNLKKGDTFANEINEYKAIVDSVVEKPFGILRRKYLYLHQVTNPSHVITWVEGVGSFIDPTVYNGAYVTGGTSRLSCFEENGQMIYHNPAYSNCFYTSTFTVENPFNRFKVYPNPASNELQIEGDFHEKEYSLQLYSINGELIKTVCMEGITNLYHLNVSSLQSGPYILRIITTSGQFSEQVIIKK